MGENIRVQIIQCYSVNNRSIFLFFFIVVLLSCLSLFSEYVSAEDAQQKAEGNDEKIISVLQKGIERLNYKIQRDQEAAFRDRKRTGIRQLRIDLKKDFGPKEQLINDLKLHLAEKLMVEIGFIQKTLEQTMKIVKAVKVDSFRVGRHTRNIIKQSISVEENILASFEKFLSKLQ